MEKTKSTNSNVTDSKKEDNNKEQGKSEHKVAPDMYGSGYDNERHDYRSKHGENKDERNHKTSESNTHRAGQNEEQSNNEGNDQDSFHE